MAKCKSFTFRLWNVFMNLQMRTSDVLGIYFKHNNEAALWWLGQQRTWTAHSSSQDSPPTHLNPFSGFLIKTSPVSFNWDLSTSVNFCIFTKFVSSKLKELSSNCPYEEQKSMTQLWMPKRPKQQVFNKSVSWK